MATSEAPLPDVTTESLPDVTTESLPDVTTQRHTSDVTTQLSSTTQNNNDITSSTMEMTSQTSESIMNPGNSPMTTASTDSGGSSSEGFFSDIEMYHYGIFGAVGVILLVVVIIVCCLCCRRCKRKKQEKKDPFDSPNDLHNYRAKITANEQKAEPASQSQASTIRYVNDPTHQPSTGGSGRREADSGLYEAMPNDLPGPTTRQGEPHGTGQHHYPPPPQQNAFQGHRQRPMKKSGSYSNNIEGDYRGSKHHTSGHGVPVGGPPDERRHGRYQSHTSTSLSFAQVHGQSQEPHSRQGGQGYSQYKTQQTLQAVPERSAPSHYHSNAHPTAVNQSHQSPPRRDPVYDRHVANSHGQYGSRPQGDAGLREPRTRPMYVKYDPPQYQHHHHHSKYTTNPTSPPLTLPKPTIAKPPVQNKPAIDMEALKQNLKPSGEKQSKADSAGSSTGDELSLNPLFNKIKEAIGTGCKTIRLYKTDGGDFALQPFHADEQEVYEDAETARAHVGRSSRHISDFRSEVADTQDEQIYDFIRHSMMQLHREPMEDEEADHVAAGASHSNAAAEQQPASSWTGYKDPDDQHGVTRIYDRTGTQKRDPEHITLKIEHENAGVLSELKQRQTSHSQEDYENVPEHVGPTCSYQNEHVVQALHDAGPAGARGGYGGEEEGCVYENHGSSDPPQEDYTNQEVIDAISAQGPGGHGGSQTYENEGTINSIAQAHANAAFEGREYENSELIEILADVQRKKEAKAQQQQQSHNEQVYQNIQLRQSMPNEVLADNVGQLFDSMLRESAQNKSPKAPVMRKKSRKEASTADPHADNHISRSSLFADVEAESGPENRTNMGGWAQNEAVTSQMISSKAQVAHVQPKQSGGLFGKFFRR